MTTNTAQATNSWDLARRQFLEEKRRFLQDLSPSERRLYEDASLETILHQSNESHEIFHQTDTLNKLRQKLKPLMYALDGYGKGLDVISNISGVNVFMAPIWGSIRVVLHMAQQTYEFFEKLIDMLVQVGNSLPQFQDYESLFSSHERLLLRLSDAYLNIARFCKEVKCLFKTAKSRKVSKLSFTLSCKSLWPPFTDKFAHFLQEFEQQHKQVILEVDISHMTEAKKERILQQNARELIERNRKESKLRQALDKMSSVNYQIQHEKLRQARCARTATWIFDNDSYQRWLAQTESALLGIFGIPGSGKSILASQVIDALSPSYEGDASLCYYYCDYADRRTLSTYSIIATILRQCLGYLIAQRVGLQDWIVEQFHEQQFRPPIDYLISKFLEILTKSTAVCLVLDGLDELDDEEQVILAATMARLLQAKNCQMKILVSCRGESMQRKKFWYSGFSVTMSPQLLGRDMQMFVEHAIEAKIRDGELNLDDASLKQEVVAKLTDGAHDMFLWVHFQIAELCEARSDEDIRRVLEDLPRDLSKTFLRIATRIYDSKTVFCKERVEMIICWLICARRPLTIEELSEALAIREDDICLVRDRIVQDGKQLLQDCGNLVIIDPQDGSVKFAHHTVREFFIQRHWELNSIVNAVDPDDDNPSRNMLPVANSKVARLCLQYLHFSDFESQITLRPSESQALVPLNEGFIGAIVPQQLSPIAKAVADCFVQSTHGSREITLKFPQKEEHSPLEQKYHMLDYVASFWPYHYPQPDIQYHRDLAAMAQRVAFEKQFTFRCRPWDIPEYADLSPTHFPSLKKSPPPPALAAFRWSIDEGNASVLSMILEYHHTDIAEYIRFESQSTLSSREVLRRAALSLCIPNLRKVARAIKEQRWMVPFEEINSLLSSKQPQAFSEAMHAMRQSGVYIGYGGVVSSIWSNAPRTPYWYGQRWKYSTADYGKIFTLQLSEAIKMNDVICVEILTSLGAVPKQLHIHQAAFNGQDELLSILCKAFVAPHATQRENNVLYLRELRESLYIQRLVVQGNIIMPFCEMPSICHELGDTQINLVQVTEREAREVETLQPMKDERRRDQTVVDDNLRQRREMEERKGAQKEKGRKERHGIKKGPRGKGDSPNTQATALIEYGAPHRRNQAAELVVERSQRCNMTDSWRPSEKIASKCCRKDDGNYATSNARHWSWSHESSHHGKFPLMGESEEKIPKFLEVKQSVVVINKDALMFVLVCSCGVLVFIVSALVLVLSNALGLLPS